jgi:hypothetical protein
MIKVQTMFINKQCLFQFKHICKVVIDRLFEIYGHKSKIHLHQRCFLHDLRCSSTSSQSLSANYLRSELGRGKYYLTLRHIYVLSLNINMGDQTDRLARTVLHGIALRLTKKLSRNSLI